MILDIAMHLIKDLGGWQYVSTFSPLNNTANNI